MHRLDDETLLAYVDGTLPPDQRREVEIALANDAHARAVVEQLRTVPATALRQAFAVESDDSKSTKLADWLAAQQARSSARRRVTRSTALVAAVAFLIIGSVVGYFASSLAPWRQTEVTTSKDWIMQVADYQRLYRRDTVAGNASSPVDIRQAEVWLSQHLGATLEIPELSTFGLRFRRGQVLFADGEPIAQLVYVPADGEPVALCIIRARGENSTPANARIHGLNLVHWQKNGFDYLIIGDAKLDLLDRIARTLVVRPAISG